VGGGILDLHKNLASRGALLIVYRGLFCPICVKQLAAVAAQSGTFDALNVRPMAVSADGAEAAAEFVARAGCGGVPVGHSLTAKAAHDDWGLWISPARAGTAEPALFAEPGLFYINGDGTLQTAWVQSAPFARPGLDDVLGAIRFQQEKQYAPRGTFAGSLPG
jgi:peroxiredoxin